MGTDMSLATEVRVDGKWRHRTSFLENGDKGFDFSEDPLERFYALFALLADVRNRYGVEPLFAGRGLPEDIESDVYDILDHAGIDIGEYGQTWASFDELTAIKWDDCSIGDCAFRRWVAGPLKQIADEFGPENVRVLMGFD